MSGRPNSQESLSDGHQNLVDGYYSRDVHRGAGGLGVRGARGVGRTGGRQLVCAIRDDDRCCGVGVLMVPQEVVEAKLPLVIISFVRSHFHLCLLYILLCNTRQA